MLTWPRVERLGANTRFSLRSVGQALLTPPIDLKSNFTFCDPVIMCSAGTRAPLGRRARYRRACQTASSMRHHIGEPYARKDQYTREGGGGGVHPHAMAILV